MSSIVFRCPLCGGEHRSRLVAKHQRHFDEVLPQLAEVLELCPVTNSWATLSFANLVWKGDEVMAGSPS